MASSQAPWALFAREFHFIVPISFLNVMQWKFAINVFMNAMGH
jgi:hypothetical protein